MTADNILAGVNQVSDLLDKGGDAVLTVLAELINGLGQGTEFTGEQVSRLGELEQQLAQKVEQLRDMNE